eukprot:m.122542 g.122542  ORF g.122542 m.122542 type:complete len:53 (+) comp28929_c1_seq2:1926-2084(+)
MVSIKLLSNHTHVLTHKGAGIGYELMYKYAQVCYKHIRKQNKTTKLKSLLTF